MLESSRHLHSLINDVLDLSRIESGRFEPIFEEVKLQKIIENSLNMVRKKAEKHKIQLSFIIDSKIDKIKADERSLKQVFYNLLSNAVKFTQDGGAIDIRANLVERNSRPGRRCNDAVHHQIIVEDIKTNKLNSANLIKCVEFAVSDNGIGINHKDIKRIFNRFEQADSSINKKFKGTGLGLALCKNIIELHGGHIWVESKGEGQGCTFRSVIPV